MATVKFQHPKTKQIHEIEDNPKFTAPLTRAGFRRMSPKSSDGPVAGQISEAVVGNDLELTGIEKLKALIDAFEDGLDSLTFEEGSDDGVEAKQLLSDCVQPIYVALQEEEPELDPVVALATVAIPTLMVGLEQHLPKRDPSLPPSVGDAEPTDDQVKLVEALKELLAMPSLADYLPVPAVSESPKTPAVTDAEAATAEALKSATESGQGGAGDASEGRDTSSATSAPAASDQAKTKKAKPDDKPAEGG
jgi:hypothetical protein